MYYHYTRIHTCTIITHADTYMYYHYTRIHTCTIITHADTYMYYYYTRGYIHVLLLYTPIHTCTIIIHSSTEVAGVYLIYVQHTAIYIHTSMTLINV